MTDTTHSEVEAVARALVAIANDRDRQATEDGFKVSHSAIPVPYALFDRLRKALAAMPPQAPGWRPIAEAPKDGSFVMLFAARYEPPISMGYWDDAFGIMKNAGWMMVEMDTMLSAVTPTHFRPLPAPPLESDDG